MGMKLIVLRSDGLKKQIAPAVGKGVSKVFRVELYGLHKWMNGICQGYGLDHAVWRVGVHSKTCCQRVNALMVPTIDPENF